MASEIPSFVFFEPDLDYAWRRLVFPHVDDAGADRVWCDKELIEAFDADLYETRDVADLVAVAGDYGLPVAFDDEQEHPSYWAAKKDLTVVFCRRYTPITE